MENIHGTMNRTGEILRVLAAGTLGLFASAMLTEGLPVPYWRSLKTDAFYAWYGANDKRLVGSFGPLTCIAATTTLVTGETSTYTGFPDRLLDAAAGILSLCAVAMFPVHFKGANARFSAGRMPPDVLREELAQWARWHRIRSILSVAAFASGLIAI